MIVRHDLGLRLLLPFSRNPEAVARVLADAARVAPSGGGSETARRSALHDLVAAHELSIAASGPDTPPCGPEVALPAETYARETQAGVWRTIGALSLLVNSLSTTEGRKALVYVSDGIPLTPGEELFQILFEICGGGAASSGVSGSSLGLDPGRRPEGTLFDSRTLGPGAYQAHAAALDAQRYSTVARWEALAARAAAQQVTFYTLMAGGPGVAAASVDGGAGERLLQLPSVSQVVTANLQGPLALIASRTGGRALLQGDLGEQLARVSADFDSYYSLAFSPTHRGDGREHRLEVRVPARPELRVRHRLSYRDKSPLERSIDRMLAALVHGFSDNPLEVAIEVGDAVPALGGGLDLPVRLRIPIFRLALEGAADAYRGSLRLLAVTRDPQGSVSAVRQVAIPITIPLEQLLVAHGRHFVYELRLRAGADERLAVALRDERSALTSYLGVDLGAAPAPGSAPPG
jgi:VWFA-related protein